MRTFIAILLTFASIVRSQWLPLYSATNVTNPEYANAPDNRYAVLSYVEKRGLPNYRYLKLQTGTLNVIDTFTLYIYGIFPASADFQIAVQQYGVDSSSFYVLHSHTPFIPDNQAGAFDTVLVLRLPIYPYPVTFEKVVFIRSWSPREGLRAEDVLVDGVFIEFPKVITPRDTIIFDTVVSSVKQVKKKKFRIRRVEPYDIRGARVDTLRAPWWIENDSLGLKRIRIRK